LSQEYETRTEENARFATFSTDNYYAEVPILESDNDDDIQEKIAKAKQIFELETTQPE
jgi:hypothetical protein